MRKLLVIVLILVILAGAVTAAAQVGNDWRIDMGGGELGVLTCDNGQLSVTVYSAEFISVKCTGFKAQETQ